MLRLFSVLYALYVIRYYYYVMFYLILLVTHTIILVRGCDFTLMSSVYQKTV